MLYIYVHSNIYVQVRSNYVVRCTQYVVQGIPRTNTQYLVRLYLYMYIVHRILYHVPCASYLFSVHVYKVQVHSIHRSATLYDVLCTQYKVHRTSYIDYNTRRRYCYVRCTSCCAVQGSSYLVRVRCGTQYVCVHIPVGTYEYYHGERTMYLVPCTL